MMTASSTLACFRHLYSIRSTQ